MFSFLRRKNRPVDPPEVRLMKSIKFVDKDLDANRSGVLTNAQRKRIQRGQVWSAVFWWAMALIFAVPVVFMASRRDWQTEPAVWLMSLAALAFVGLAFWQQNQTKKILINNQAASVSGPLSRRIDMVYTGKVFIPIHKIKVDDKSFTVDHKAYEAFVEGELYTIYYVPETEQILSVEMPYTEKEKRLADPGLDAVQVDYLDSESEHSQVMSD